MSERTSRKPAVSSTELDFLDGRHDEPTVPSRAFSRLDKVQAEQSPVQARTVTPTPPPSINQDAISNYVVEPTPAPSGLKGVSVIVTLAGVSFLNTMGSGILIAALPQIAIDVGIPQGLILWPATVYALAAGCLLLPFGATADAIGPKRVWVTGSFAFMIFTLAVGLARTALQIILFRTCLGVAISMCLPTAMSLITHTFPRGTWRNVAFAMNGMGQPLGYALGLVLGGIFTDGIGWRWAYYMMAIINFALSTASIWLLPEIKPADMTKTIWTRLAEDVDFVGAAILSVAAGILLYVLGTTTSSYRSIKSVPSIVLLVVSISLLIAFPWWTKHQTVKGGPALIPNGLWRNAAFTSICLAVFFSWASMNGIEYFTTLYFQQIQGLTALQSSIRFLTHVLAGILTNIVTAYLVSRVKVRALAVVSAAITMIASPLMATVVIGESYWLSPFWALTLSPINPDVLFTVSNLILSDAFPPELQSLAGGVFNEVSQFGNSVGLAVTAAIAASVDQHSHIDDPRLSLMQGFRAAFWTIFAGTAAVFIICLFGLGKGGIVGKKNN